MMHIPAGRYAVLTTAKGPVYQVVPEAWQHIWALSPAQLGGQRTFQSDYEVYDQRERDPQNAEVEVHIGLK